MHLPPPPDSRELLPPLLACLPTAFLSPRPPPALLPLLSPFLRQRINYLASTSTNNTDGWLPLLSWDQERASKLPAIVEHMQLEPHPISGEVEMEDVRPAKYRRLDEETLQARLEVEQFELVPTYVWCETDDEGNAGPGWKLAELKSMEDLDDDGAVWYDTQVQADDACKAARTLGVPQSDGRANGSWHVNEPSADDDVKGDDDDDDDYWASYDRTPGRTPANDHSPAPANQPATTTAANRPRSQSEQQYFAQYGHVQPAMDAHDPDEEHPHLGQTTLNGSSLLPHQQPARPDSRPNGTSMFPADADLRERDAEGNDAVTAPRPLSPTSSHSSVERLEEKAAAMSGASSDHAQLAIKQHISTDIKSLFRLARSAGMERREFERIVKTELGVLSLLEEDD